MRVLLIEASPKRRFSNTGYFLWLLRRFLPGCTVETIKLHGPRDYPAILDALDRTDALVLGLPVYVDAVPSHVLRLLKEIEGECLKEDHRFKVYALANCGFYEGAQCRNLMAMLRCWCARAGLEWAGGVGVGAGEMLGFIRVVPFIAVGTLLLRTAIWAAVLAARNAFIWAALLGGISWYSPLITLAVFLLFSAGLLRAAGKLGRGIREGKPIEEHYTGLTCCPRFLFVFFANIFWGVRALLHGVLPWQLYKKP